MIGLRSFLFVPGDRADRIAKARSGPAHAVVVDLEDAVAPAAKDGARGSAAAAIGGRPRNGGPLLAVRVNGVASGLLEDDLAALEPVLHRLGLIVLPMVSGPADVAAAAALLGAAERRAGVERPRGLLPLIETARGVLAAPEIAAADERVATLSVGPADLSAELGVEPTARGEALEHARSRLVLACAAAGLGAPIDGPFLDVRDHEGMLLAAARARLLGFAGKMALHPAQVEAVNAEFAPTEAELRRAREVDRAFRAAEARGVASIALADGTFVDPPVAARARSVLERAR
ncbi:citrate lyase subunit beta/citryl-CoA lyase [Spinactinospora alkalitolerans]|uniref:Citrate lyase subunit beta/citryl-CoA lyase n=1 Tax=Spinactinospora alkalitolerans TaxID=687207 RepID=A0A852TZM5_9ACTN|nr:CoA ester lyase [Spinactinospora alkalitolerans]NYE48223.1 citrate lyase subunit beta/citryl-CoA lyase [Spinactinospora alkalitolerans]